MGDSSLAVPTSTTYATGFLATTRGSSYLFTSEKEVRRCFGSPPRCLWTSRNFGRVDTLLLCTDGPAEPLGKDGGFHPAIDRVRN